MTLTPMISYRKVISRHRKYRKVKVLVFPHFIWIVVVMLTSCSQWPEPGRGGLAEDRPTTLNNDKGVRSIELELVRLERSFNNLKNQGINECIPAKLKQLDMGWVITQRELHAGMIEDAVNDLEKLKHTHLEIICHFNAIQFYSQCGLDDINKDRKNTIEGLPYPWSIKFSNTDKYQKSIEKGIDLSEQKNWSLFHELQNCRFSDLHAVKFSGLDADMLKIELNFNPNESRIKSIYQYSLELAANFLHNNQDFIVSLEGHSDSTGLESYNLDLSESRAIEILNYFINAGIDENRFTVKAKGEKEPHQSNDSAVGRQLNRRVTVLLRRSSK